MISSTPEIEISHPYYNPDLNLYRKIERRGV